MKRLTTNNPKGMCDGSLNAVYIKNNEAYLRYGTEDGKDISLVDYCKVEAKKTDRDYDDVSVEDFGDVMCRGELLDMFYFIACGHAELREKLIKYENAAFGDIDKPFDLSCDIPWIDGGMRDCKRPDLKYKGCVDCKRKQQYEKNNKKLNEKQFDVEIKLELIKCDCEKIRSIVNKINLKKETARFLNEDDRRKLAVESLDKRIKKATLLSQGR